VTIRWSDGRSGLIYPVDTGAEVRIEDQLLLILDRAPLAPELRPLGLTPVREGTGFAVYRWEPEKAWGATEKEMGTGVAPADLGALVCVGTRFDPTAAPGETLTVSTLWQVGDPEVLGPVPAESYGRQAAIFLHLLDPLGNIAVQDDRLGVPAWDWRAGDRFIQLHRLVLPSNAAPGAYRLAVGVYSVPDMVRLTLPTGADSWDLGTVEVGVP
jgi:hypothetical protein